MVPPQECFLTESNPNRALSYWFIRVIRVIRGSLFSVLATWQIERFSDVIGIF